ncbi:MAG: phosphoenolpyruvate carboxykinase, partial [Chloroflexota bacterium]
FNERFYDYWRKYERYIVCDSEGDELDKRPYRTFNATIESLMHLVRSLYRDIQENITGKHPNIFRQVHAGAELATIALPKEVKLPEGSYQKLNGIGFIRQVLLYPPFLLHSPMNKRTGQFDRVHQNPLAMLNIDKNEWLCYPAKVGSLLILIYFHEKFFELGCSLCNLFELAEDEALNQKPDAIFLYGVPGRELDGLAQHATVFYDDREHNVLVGAIPNRDEFGYFGYLKKMVLTLHNIKVMKMGRLPFHGAMIKIDMKKGNGVNILIIGDTGAGKSETLEAFRQIGDNDIREITIIADDMGSLEIGKEGIIGYGTETGAFVRLDDLQPGYAFGQIDRTIIMNPSQVNARVVLPVTTYENIVRGFPVDMILYANNYEETDENHPIIEELHNPEAALSVFREGTAMSKGTTTSTGLVHTYFVNIFGAIQYQSLHDEIAQKYFEEFYRKGLFVGQLRTMLGIPGWEHKGPEEAAKALLKLMNKI